MSEKQRALARLASLLAACGRVAVLGVGSELRQDDYAGMAAAEALLPLADGRSVLVALGGAAPENCTGPIRRFRPDVVLVLDAAHMGLEPGAYAILDPKQITGATFSTHMLPLPVTLSYLETTCGCRAAYIGIQPACVDQGVGMCPAVQAGVKRLTDELRGLLHPAAGK